MVDVMDMEDSVFRRKHLSNVEFLRDKSTVTTGINPDRNVEQIDSPCPVHPKGGTQGQEQGHVETLGYDDRDDTYLQRCTYTGETWWIRKKTS